MNNKLLTVSSSPHIRTEDDVSKIMWQVNIALIPALLVGVYIFGYKALVLTMVGGISAVLTEYIIQKIFKQPVTISDGSAFMTGILLAYNVPPTLPVWMIVVGSVFAIAIAKHCFGGLGKNIFNPALIGRAFLLASYPVAMTSWTKGTGAIFDTVSMATPLGLVKTGSAKIISMSNVYEYFGGRGAAYLNMFLGNIDGCIGEISALALLIGAGYLLYKKIIGPFIPFSFLLSLAVMTWIFGGDHILVNGVWKKTYFSGDFIFHILSGGAILGAFFMATDMVTSPITLKGHLIFGTGCGIITAVIRIWGGYPEGVSYSILLMNALVPLIDRYTKPKVFGSKH